MLKFQSLCICAAIIVAGRIATASSIEEVHGFEPRFVMPPDAGMVSIRDFGAVGDGKTDDTAAFRKAIGTDQPRAIYIPNGVYVLKDQLRFGVDGKQKKKVTLIGESRSKSILKLAPSSDGFGDSGAPKAFIHARHPKQQGEQNMHNYLMHLTIEIGEGNPGAVALEYHTNNTGAVKDVAIRATDPVNGRGLVGLACNEWEVGPASVRYVSVEGFKTGVHLGRIANYVTVEHLTVSKCDTGIDTGTASIRKLRTSDTALPLKVSGQVVLLDSDLSGPGDVAIDVTERGGLLARNVRTEGFEEPIANTTVPVHQRLAVIEEIVVGKSIAIAGAETRTLGLPIVESPELQYPQSPTEWVVLPGGDISKPMQEAIDRGVTTIFITAGGGKELTETVHIRNRVTRIMGVGNAYVTIKTGDKPAFVLDDGDASTVFCELVYGNYGGNESVRWLHNSKRTLVFRHGEGSYDSTPQAAGANVFVDNVVGYPFRFNAVHAWLRDINTEQGGPDAANIVNRGGKLWVLGQKTEDFATKIASYNGETELLGGTFRQNWDDEDFEKHGIRDDARPPLFLVEGGRASFTYTAWGTPSGKAYDVLIRHVDASGVVSEVRRAEQGGSAMLATAGKGDRSP